MAKEASFTICRPLFIPAGAARLVGSDDCFEIINGVRLYRPLLLYIGLFSYLPAGLVGSDDCFEIINVVRFHAWYLAYVTSSYTYVICHIIIHICNVVRFHAWYLGL